MVTRDEPETPEPPKEPPDASRQPATPEEERALEMEELDSFRRRKAWEDEVLGHGTDAERRDAD